MAWNVESPLKGTYLPNERCHAVGTVFLEEESGNPRGISEKTVVSTLNAVKVPILPYLPHIRWFEAPRSVPIRLVTTCPLLLASALKRQNLTDKGNKVTVV